MLVPFLFLHFFTTAQMPEVSRSDASERVFFADDSAIISNVAQKQAIERIQKLMAGNAKHLILAGYADPSDRHDICAPEIPYLIALAERRATSVRAVLLDKDERLRPRVHQIPMGMEELEKEPSQNRVVAAILTDPFTENLARTGPATISERQERRNRVDAALTTYEACRKRLGLKSVQVDDEPAVTAVADASNQQDAARKPRGPPIVVLPEGSEVFVLGGSTTDKLKNHSGDIIVENLDDLSAVRAAAGPESMVFFNRSGDAGKTLARLETPVTQMHLHIDLPTDQASFRKIYETSGFATPEVIEDMKKILNVACHDVCGSILTDRVYVRPDNRASKKMPTASTHATEVRRAIEAAKPGDLHIMIGHVNERGEMRFRDGSGLRLADIKTDGSAWALGCTTAGVSPVAGAGTTRQISAAEAVKMLEAAMKGVNSRPNGTYRDGLAALQKHSPAGVGILGVAILIQLGGNDDNVNSADGAVK